MRAERIEEKFKEVRLVLETQDEVDKLMAIFEHTSLTDALEFNENYYQVLDQYTKEEDYNKWWERLNDMLEERER